MKVTPKSLMFEVSIFSISTLALLPPAKIRGLRATHRVYSVTKAFFLEARISYSKTQSCSP